MIHSAVGVPPGSKGDSLIVHTSISDPKVTNHLNDILSVISNDQYMRLAKQTKHLSVSDIYQFTVFCGERWMKKNAPSSYKRQCVAEFENFSIIDCY
jgi:hypothetical protein